MTIYEEIQAEVERASAKFTDFDLNNTRNDYIAYCIAYLGRASEFVARNEREGLDPREMLIKAAGLIVRAIEETE